MQPRAIFAILAVSLLIAIFMLARDEPATPSDVVLQAPEPVVFEPVSLSATDPARLTVWVVDLHQDRPCDPERALEPPIRDIIDRLDLPGEPPCGELHVAHDLTLEHDETESVGAQMRSFDWYRFRVTHRGWSLDEPDRLNLDVRMSRGDPTRDLLRTRLRIADRAHWAHAMASQDSIVVFRVTRTP